MPKTLAIRMDDDTHAQLTVLAQLQDMPGLRRAETGRR